jgi:hypothetical protein
MIVITINDKEYKDLASVAETRRYNPEYLRRIVKEGKIDAVQIGSAWVIHEPDLARYEGERRNRGSRPGGHKPPKPEDKAEQQAAR